MYSEFKEPFISINSIESYFFLVAILSGTRNHGHSRLSHQIFDKINHLFPKDEERIVSASILLANTYALSGELEKASNIKSKYLKLNTKKKIGVSWTEIDGELVVNFLFVNDHDS